MCPSPLSRKNHSSGLNSGKGKSAFEVLFWWPQHFYIIKRSFHLYFLFYYFVFFLVKNRGRRQFMIVREGRIKNLWGGFLRVVFFPPLKSLLIQPSLLKYLWLCSKFDCVEFHVLILCNWAPPLFNGIFGWMLVPCCMSNFCRSENMSKKTGMF